MTPANERALAALVEQQSGIVLGPAKLGLLQTQLVGLLREEGVPDLDALATRIGACPGGVLARKAIEAVTTNETLFFRDDSCFDHLREAALPALRAARPPDHRLRVWSAAASTGQEAYSVAISVIENRPAWPSTLVEILASDIAQAPLRRVEAAIYSEFEVRRGLSGERLDRHFERVAEGWRATAALRHMVHCRTWNLLHDPAPLGVFDVILCRNVLLYFAVPTRRHVLDGLARRLSSDGYLYVGGSEALLGVSERFVPIPAARGVFRTAPG